MKEEIIKAKLARNTALSAIYMAALFADVGWAATEIIKGEQISLVVAMALSGAAFLLLLFAVFSIKFEKLIKEIENGSF